MLASWHCLWHTAHSQLTLQYTASSHSTAVHARIVLAYLFTLKLHVVPEI
jgi:hypothetical protein